MTKHKKKNRKIKLKAQLTFKTKLNNLQTNNNKIKLRQRN